MASWMVPVSVRATSDLPVGIDLQIIRPVAKVSATHVFGKREKTAQSRDHLRVELDLEEIFFAYPFGEQADMSPEALVMAKKAGYGACLSAYGGVNQVPVDAFNVLRMGADFNFGPNRFAARVEGWWTQIPSRPGFRRQSRPVACRIAPLFAATNRSRIGGSHRVAT
ncbi:MAG: hypothetical protein KGJ32_00335 [Xanthomonadaceae bacterium]|nr:hypothetical protein [Xanthomonadaceae bacterium]